MRTRREMVRAELGESWDHFLAAATHAASGVGQSVGPRAIRVKGAATRGWDTTAATLVPLAAAYRVGAADATAAALRLKKRSLAGMKGRSVSKKRRGMLMGLLAGGVALGAVAAMMARMRRRHQWAEYDPSAALDAMSADTRSMMEKAASKGGGKMANLSHHTSMAMDRTAEKLQSAASSMRKPEADEAAQRAGGAGQNMASKPGSNNRP